MASSSGERNKQRRQRKSGLHGLQTLGVPATDVPDGLRMQLNRGTSAPGQNPGSTSGQPLVEMSRRHTLPPNIHSQQNGGIPARRNRATFPVGHAELRKSKYTLRWEINEKGREPGQLRKPTDLCFIDNENLVVAESKNSRLQIFGPRGRRVCIDRSVAPDLLHPTSVCKSLDGSLLLVADLNQVHYFNLEGEQEETWPPDIGRRGADEFANITAMGVNRDNNLVIAEHRRECSVGVYCQESGQPIHRCKLRSGQEFFEPSYICCDRNTGITYVSDSVRGCVECFDKDGRHIHTLGGDHTHPGVNNGRVGGTDGRLICPLGMHLDAQRGELLVADKGANAIVTFSLKGGIGGQDCSQSHTRGHSKTLGGASAILGGLGALTGFGGLGFEVTLSNSKSSLRATSRGSMTSPSMTSLGDVLLTSPEHAVRDPVAVAVSPSGTLAVATHSMDFGVDDYAVRVFKRARVK